MAGEQNKQAVLNATLMFILKLLNHNNINNWFIGYGTLLGIVRKNSCIDGDYDIDIIIDKNNYDVIKKILIENDIEIEYGYGIGESRKILKTKKNNDYCSIDFYMACVNEKGDFNDQWEHVIWSECYDENNKLIQHMWNENILYVPFNYETKLFNRYGTDWRIPRKNYKGPVPPKNIL